MSIRCLLGLSHTMLNSMCACSLQMLNDHEWAAAFLQRNQRSLEESYDALTGELAAVACPLVVQVYQAIAGGQSKADGTPHSTLDSPLAWCYALIYNMHLNAMPCRRT